MKDSSTCGVHSIDITNKNDSFQSPGLSDVGSTRDVPIVLVDDDDDDESLTTARPVSSKRKYDGKDFDSTKSYGSYRENWLAASNEHHLDASARFHFDQIDGKAARLEKEQVQTNNGPCDPTKLEKQAVDGPRIDSVTLNVKRREKIINESEINDCDVLFGKFPFQHSVNEYIILI